ncbi:YdiY family protein [Thioalkalivibrio sp.]|uniref:DUF481 domain-containing protein n=1 Tax=Thioalkalivibrio sp. TaxID=2093813 RepID=UPI0035632FDF
MLKTTAICSILCLSATPLLVAAEAATSPWSGEFDFGVSAKTGNTESTDLSARLRASYEVRRWHHRLRLDAVRETESSSTTDESYLAQFQSDYDLTERSYLFGVVRGERDLFSSFRYQTSISGGYGYRAWVSERGHLDLEAGPGVRYSERDTGEEETEFVGRLRGKLEVRLSHNADFNQEVTVITGSKNTETESISSVTAGITDALALRLSLEVERASKVPAGTKKTDTTTTASAVYRF